MKRRWIVLLTCLTIGMVFVNLLGFMNLFPLYITSPLLFIAIFLTLYFINHRKTFRGF
ncbi:MAG TPA: hypothetical protein VEY70_02150 [Metabacillus sp.]|nr:hypothetical protein [Metabacillus sp.]